MNITIISLIVIGITFLGSMIYTLYAKKKQTLSQNKRIIDSLPNIVSALGVIGTFLGITMGLKDFQTNHIDESIKTLLDGLRTAFFTSLAGMTGSLILRFFFTDKLFDKEEKGISSAEQAARIICEEIKNIRGDINQNAKNQNQMLSCLQGIQSAQLTFFNSVQTQLTNISANNIDAMSSFFDTLLLLAQNQSQNIENIKSVTNELNNKQSMQLEAVSNIIVHTKELNDNLSEVLDITSANNALANEHLTETKKYSEVLSAEVDEIETKMAETNKLLTEKFDEFSILLQKSNTEALVEVMKKVTEEFQKQMNDLISRLVKENFEQLNKSVENLNMWQKENKEMISQLTTEYEQMATQFKGTSEHLTLVANDTKSLVGNGGKLSQLIEQLNKVMIDDKKFVEIATKLEQSASLTQDSISKFDQSNKSLENWIQKHQSFVNEVEKLIAKLEELDKIRDYSEQFWNETKKGMNDGVATIKQGAEALNNQLTSLDQQFYARLSTTLGELDACIQAMVNNNKNL